MCFIKDERGFYEKKQKEYEQYLIDTGRVTRAQIDEYWVKMKDPSLKDGNVIKDAWDGINKNMRALLEEHVGDSKIVQDVIHEHFLMVSNFWTPDQKSYEGLADLYAEHPDFVAYFKAYSPNFLELLTKAMKIYAKILP